MYRRTFLGGKFINGLQENIWAEVRLLGPMSLDHASGVGGEVEDIINSHLHRGQVSKMELGDSKPS